MITGKVIAMVLIAGFALANVIGGAIGMRSYFPLMRQIWRGFLRPLRVLEVLGAMTITIAFLVLLFNLHPVFKWGWWALIKQGVVAGERGSDNTGGNILLAPATEAATSDIPILQAVALSFFLLLLFAMPFFAYMEEEAFRWGHNDKKSMLKQSIKFGLIHLLVGVPIGGGIVLIFMGLFYHWKYLSSFRKFSEMGYDYWEAEGKAIIVSATYHSLFNSILVAFPLVLTMLLMFF